MTTAKATTGSPQQTVAQSNVVTMSVPPAPVASPQVADDEKSAASGDVLMF